MCYRLSKRNKPENPFSVTSHSSAPRMPNKHKDGIARRRPGPPPEYCVLMTEEQKMRGTYEVCIPHSNGILHANLTHEQTVHPSKGELHELDILRLQMRRQRSCKLFSEKLTITKTVTNHQYVQLVRPSSARFSQFQVVQKYNCLGCHQANAIDTRRNLLRSQTKHGEVMQRDRNPRVQNLGLCEYDEKALIGKEYTNVGRQKNLKKGSNKIVDSLHITAGRMPDGPNVEYPF